MGLVDALLLTGLFLFGLPISWLLGWLLAKIFRAPFLERLLPALVLIVVIAGYPLALRIFGEPGSGRLLSKEESVVIFNRGGGWAHTYHFRMRYRPPHAERADAVVRDPTTDSITIDMRASRAQFDRTPVGAMVPIVYVPFRPSLAKLSERTLGDLIAEMTARRETRFFLGVVACIIVAVMLSGWRPATPSGRTARLAGFLLCLFAGFASFGLSMFSPVLPRDAPPVTESAVARVVTVRRMTNGPMSGRTSYQLAFPYDIVELQFTPRAPATTMSLVHAVDAVDTVSARGLAHDSTVRIHYAATDPRTARIDGATRIFEAGNLRDRRAGVRWVVLLLIGLIVVSVMLARRKRRA